MDQDLLNETLQVIPVKIYAHVSNHCSMTIHAIAMFRGLSEWLLSDISDEPMFLLIWHILMELCHF